MNKLIAVSAVLALFAAGTVSALSYSYPTYGTSSFGCVMLTNNLSYGSRGSEVTKLQQFLVTQNYPGGGSWMVTGYFGNATVQAVRNFQQTARLSTTGYVDAATRAAIQTRTCGLLSAPQNFAAPISFPPTLGAPALPTPPYVPGTTIPPYTPNYPFSSLPYGGVSISSLSTYSAYVGSSVTIHGSGFDTTGTNTVHIGGSTVVVASSGTAITFTVPSTPNGTYSVYVTNSRGTSNSLSLTVSQAQSVCNQTPWYQPWNWYGSQYQCGIFSNVNLNSITPNWASVGTMITLKGNGFSPSNNTVYMGGSIVTASVSTNNGTELTFTVPTHLSGPYGSQPVVPGHYPVRVVNATGAESNSLTLSITQQGSSSLSIASTSGPSSIQAGVQS
ncbi:IPT/TIG domain-containing protein, partial [Candidatus Kaiserbacteria bacterium]|nr:IPT/TIG domain-containing protein [Candidatus Kaiserbacteria bacterium]